MRRESDDGYVCAACGETVYNDSCACEDGPYTEDEWDEAEDIAERLEGKE